ncbi:MAG: AAA family ATPase [Synechococcales bacterium]|nr:AAA family ATPase [Synechococcales bacterium]
MALTGHILIGPPGAGKSTLAATWQKHDPALCIVSTDRIRAELFGDAAIQGEWSQVEAQVLQQIQQAIAAGQSVVYDATNAKRSWRLHLLQQLRQTCEAANQEPVQWVGWYLKTPLATCHSRNQGRSRSVDDSVIDDMAQALKQFPPVVAEGFAAVYAISTEDEDAIIPVMQDKLERLSRTLINRRNRSAHLALHRYSALLDFERLLFLMALLIQHPGLGHLHGTHPDWGQTWLPKQALDEQLPQDTLDEICALMAQQYHPVYADPGAIAADLVWLEENHLLGPDAPDAPLQLSPYPGSPYPGSPYPGSVEACIPHSYSDREVFERLLRTIRFIVHYPLLSKAPGQTSLDRLCAELQTLTYTTRDSLRKDIEQVLKPYGILPSAPMKRGYFIGTAVLAKHELLDVFKVVQTQAENLEDPLSLRIYQILKERLTSSRFIDRKDAIATYPIRAIGNQTIVDTSTLPDYAAYRKLDTLVDAIRSATQLELNRITGTGRFADDPHQGQPFRVWPLQLVFHNIGWYLGYEWIEGKAPHLLRFERLDRLFVVQPLPQQRSHSQQRQALDRLTKLYRASAGLHLGNSAADQARYLSANKAERAAVEMTLELWCNDDIFRFISEGTQRFPAQQMRFSPLPGRASHQHHTPRLFSLKPSGDRRFPHRFQVTLPHWSAQDVDLLRWLLGFGAAIKVVQPTTVVEKIQHMARGICQVYGEER